MTSLSRNAVSAALGLALLLAAIAIGGALAGPAGSKLDLAGQFAGFATALAVVAGAGYLLRGARRMAAISAALALIGFAATRTPAPVAACTGESLRIAFHNVWVRNDDTEKTVRVLLDLDADVLALSEMTPRLRTALAPLIEAYPHRACGDGTCRAMLLSRVPLTPRTGDIENFGGPPALIAADLAFPSGPLRLVGAHLTRPWPFDAPGDQRRQSEGILKGIDNLGAVDLVVGDFNAAPWSAILRLMTERGDLRVLPGAGTWPRWLRPRPLPIDQALIGPAVACAKKRTAAPTGSDHLPIVVDLRLRDGTASQILPE